MPIFLVPRWLTLLLVWPAVCGCACLLLVLRFGALKCSTASSPLRAMEMVTDDLEMFENREEAAVSGLRDHRPRTLSEVQDDQQTSTLHLVRVSTLCDALATRPAADVRRDLFSSDSLLERDAKVGTLTGVGATFALISYRQERRPEDDCTLDEEALRSVAEVAHAAGIQHVWLDAWCYRQPGEHYVHADFCQTLATVATHAGAVVWLPIARRGAAPSYPFRLWCTFGTRTATRILGGAADAPRLRLTRT